jgi:hypothetical protein
LYAASAPPAKYPVMSAAWAVVSCIEMPSTYLLPVRIRGISAERAASNGGLSSAVANRHSIIAGSGMCGTATSAMVTIRATSQMIITRRSGYRSASAVSTGPMPSHGR